MIQYIPSTDEVMKLYMMKDDEPVIQNSVVEDITQLDFEKVIKTTLCPLLKPTTTPKFETCLRVVDFEQAFNFDSNVLKFLEYYIMII
jgi:hypothetical protein